MILQESFHARTERSIVLARAFDVGRLCFAGPNLDGAEKISRACRSRWVWS